MKALKNLFKKKDKQGTEMKNIYDGGLIQTLKTEGNILKTEGNNILKSEGNEQESLFGNMTNYGHR